MPEPERELELDLIIDASVLINLLGCGAAETVLQSLPRAVSIEKRALAEVLRDPSRNLPAQGKRQLLVDRKLLQVRQPQGDAIECFLELVTEPHELNDGEAATIACAIDLGAVAVLDERKARRIARERFPALPVDSTAGLFRALLEEERIDATQIRAMLLAALQRARMSVPREDIDWVIRVLGAKTAWQCPSISRGDIRRFLDGSFH